MLSRTSRVLSSFRCTPCWSLTATRFGSQINLFRGFSTKVSPASRIQEAVREFIDLRKSELEQYEAVDASDKEETKKLIDQLSNCDVNEQTTWSSLGFDGLDEVEVVLAIEQALGVTLPDEEFHTIRSVGDAVSIFSKYTPKQG